jgi:hypothetical protein
VDKVRQFRLKTDDAYYFNWMLNIDLSLQRPFAPSHENMRALDLHKNQAPHLLASNLRRAFSGIVAGNVKEAGIRAIEEKGLFELCGDARVMQPLDGLLSAFVEQKRMKLPTSAYNPCYRLVAEEED